MKEGDRSAMLHQPVPLLLPDDGDGGDVVNLTMDIFFRCGRGEG